ncbi:MAG: FliA/WhiG family RNA polymerase sigma factor [Deltaproteobacteria bacterium]|nr:FliA/WhiG family RNA polymerase sigma factor [bacterium]MCB9478837.1 FliA/WhiG family RNA polymerase sigma factor [Deltaproteobacteria bacterium]MCB9489001.1 FliA/WhiG family RNA polymerase sigma factor [Deltaproteobacteria bacterium]
MQEAQLPQVTLESWQDCPPEQRDHLRAELIKKYTPLIKLVAMRIIRKLPPQIELDDLINTGVLGMMDAIEKYDPNRDIKFETYAEFRIRGAILDELRSLDWVPRSIRSRLNELERTYQELEAKLGRPATDDEVAHAMNLSQDEYFELVNKANGVTLVSLDDLGNKSGNNAAQKRNFLEYFRTPNQESVVSLMNMKEIKSILAEAIEDLPKNERFVVSMYYFDELTMKEIGLILGITESRVSQIHNKCIMRLRGKLKRRMSDIAS